MKNLSLVTSGGGFLGHFFVAIDLKLLLAYVFLKYDLEILPQRPDDWWMGTIVLLPIDAKLKIKMRVTPLMWGHAATCAPVVACLMLFLPRLSSRITVCYRGSDSLPMIFP